MADKLLPCPFCSGPAELTTNSDNWPVVQCDNCGAQGPCIELEKSKAVDGWNMRPVPLMPVYGSKPADE